ncbi:ADP-ribosylglycohydrolase family protein [Archangium gephyra]|uniref:ADP-ribosylglycohydrolase family protein n=1 Tax=Archangium gephyra TaxID=48 RepID=UPI0035D4653E
MVARPGRCPRLPHRDPVRARAHLRALIATEAPGAVLADIIQQSYDTDTVAAIAGGVLGARFGSGWVPRAWLLGAERVSRVA